MSWLWGTVEDEHPKPILPTETTPLNQAITTAHQALNAKQNNVPLAGAYSNSDEDDAPF